MASIVGTPLDSLTLCLLAGSTASNMCGSHNRRVRRGSRACEQMRTKFQVLTVSIRGDNGYYVGLLMVEGVPGVPRWPSSIGLMATAATFPKWKLPGPCCNMLPLPGLFSARRVLDLGSA
ncbi:hypothetical protein DFH07DRAFT_785125 [Mycena maculata]|uniref:Secreted protein n=1 Tax=Mycena maculata TaxID=230809 RepID=A0AAD7MHF1_9AGAR|nr:hypothetical protein DFH07DRAFT_785125 [Mycena maculata]